MTGLGQKAWLTEGHEFFKCEDHVGVQFQKTATSAMRGKAFILKKLWGISRKFAKCFFLVQRTTTNM